MMNEKLREYLRSINVRVVNPIWDGMGRKNIIGWHCKASSYLRMDSQITRVKEFCKRNELFYEYVEPEDFTLSFFIYK